MNNKYYWEILREITRQYIACFYVDKDEIAKSKNSFTLYHINNYNNIIKKIHRDISTYDNEIKINFKHLDSIDQIKYLRLDF